MNEHLNPVFEIILPELEKEGINYWVIGGVAIAGIKGSFLRTNSDVDLIVKNEDLNSAKAIVEKICSRHPDWRIAENLSIKERPKIEVRLNGNKIFSMKPVFIEGDEVKFIFPNSGSIVFPLDVLKPVRRKINKFSFNTPEDRYIKDLFYNHYNLLLKLHKGKEAESSHLENYKIDKEYLDSLVITSQSNIAEVAI
jgi:hypothetical protein